MNKIMIVDDTETIRNELSSFLKNCGYDVTALSEFKNVVRDIIEKNPNIVILDINLPYADGYHICRELRKKSDVPILVVTSRSSEIDELMSMNLGADDFITKPYNLHILEARISAILRRSEHTQYQDTLSYRGLILDLSGGTISYEDKSALLTRNELKMLSFLIQNQEKSFQEMTLWNICGVLKFSLMTTVSRLILHVFAKSWNKSAFPKRWKPDEDWGIQLP